MLVRDGLSSARGSKLFAGDGKGIVRILKVSLSGLAVLSLSLFAYQQYSKPNVPNLIAKDEVIQIAIKAGNWNGQTLRDKTIQTTLLHVKANGFSFVVDQRTLQETLALHQNQYPRYENQYLWIVSIIGPNNNDWVYTIDAATGEILTSP